MPTLLFPALSKYESHVAGLAVGTAFIVLGVSLLVLGPKANIGQYRGRTIRGRTIRCIGLLDIILGLIVAGVLSRWDTCSACRTDRTGLNLWLVGLVLVLGTALRRLWRRP